MKDVARAAGNFDPSTVSLALRNSPRISAKTRAKILAVAQRVGYRRDPLLDAFNLHRLEIIPQRLPRHMVAIADFSSAEELAASPHHAAARLGALEEAARLHCRLDFMFCGLGRPEPRRLDDILDARGQRAVLLFGLRADAPPMELTWSRLCVVAIDSLHVAVPLHRVSPDYFQAARLLWRKVWSDGHCRIAMVRLSSALAVCEDRAVAGFLLEQNRAAAVASPIPILTVGDDLDASLRFQRWLRMHRPDAIFCFSVASKVLSRLLGNTKLGSFALDACDAAMAGGVQPDYVEVGRRAVQKLVMLMQTNQRGLPSAPVCTYVPVGSRS